MPTYTYFNSESGEQEEHFHKIAEMDDFSARHPHLTRVITAPKNNIVTGINQKPDAGFRDVLKSIKKASGRDNTVNTF